MRRNLFVLTLFLLVTTLEPGSLFASVIPASQPGTFRSQRDHADVFTSGGSDEVDRGRIRFASPIYLSAAWITGLSAAPQGVFSETGQLMINGKEAFIFDGIPTHKGGGDAHVRLDASSPLKGPVFRSAEDSVDSGFSATGLKTHAPEPAALLLLGSGLAGIAIIRRKRSIRS